MVPAMSKTDERKARLLGVVVGLVVLVGLGVGLTVLLWPEDEPEPETVEVDDDTGLSEDAQIQLAIEIGYLQQE